MVACKARSVAAAFILSFSLISSVWSQAPDTVISGIFSETLLAMTAVRGPLISTLRPQSTAFYLNADSTFRVIYGSYPVTVGKWSYRKTGANTAVLALDGID